MSTVSGRDAFTLEKWLGRLTLGLVCEHGLAMKAPGQNWQQLAKVNAVALHRLVRPLFEEFVRRTPGSSIESKSAALAWHYRGADPEYGQFQAHELQIQLEDVLKRRPYRVLKGNRVIEVRHKAASKANAMRRIFELHAETDFVFCAGDDRTDEEMMRSIPPHLVARSVRCWVGGRNQTAEYWQKSNDKLLDELEKLVVLFGQRVPSVLTGQDDRTRSSAPERRPLDPRGHSFRDAPEVAERSGRAARAR